MAGTSIILPLKIYEVVNGSERYLWDQDWFIPWVDYDTSTGSDTTDTAVAARTSIGISDFSVVKYFSGTLYWSDFRAITFDYYIGKTISCHLKNAGDDDVYFTMTVSQVNTAAGKDLRWYPITFYRNGQYITQLNDGNFSSSYALYPGSYQFMKCACPIPWFNKAGNKVFYSWMQCHFYEINESVNYYYNATDMANNYLVNDLKRWLGDYEPIIPDDDNPYWDGGTSTESDSEGNFSDDSDDVDEDNLPTIDAVGTGFATLFTPSKGQLKALADVMWDSNIFAALQNLVENIQDLFTSLAIVPFEVTAGSTVEVTWLGLPITNINLTLAAAQYYEFDMGSINLADDSRIFTSGSALDYSPFSKLGIFLPFIGFQDLDIDECRDTTLGLKYRIDILSGTCVALISVNGNTIYQFSGNCLSQIPITNENMQSLVSDAVQVGIAATASHAASGAVSAAEGEWGAAATEKELNQANTQLAHAQARSAATRGQLASATANAAMGMKPHYGKAGSISASASLLAVKQPYLFLTTPRQSIPEHYQRYCGFPSNISGKLSSFSGFTVVEDIRLNGLVATSSEVAEIYQLLKSGVII